MTLPDSEDCSSDSPPRKRAKLDDTLNGNGTKRQLGLLSCCDDILLEIFSYLRPNDLLSLSQCCQRIQQVVFDRTLWTSVDLRPVCLSHMEIEKYIKFLLPCTNFIATNGPLSLLDILCNSLSDSQNSEHTQEPEECTSSDSSSQASSSTSEIVPSFTGKLLEKIKEAAPNLVTLILENHILDSRQLSWEQFPSGLEYLSLHRCQVSNLQPSKSFFFGVDKYLPRLKVLDVSDCTWFESHSFLALSKCPALEELRLSNNKINDFVPYISLGTRFGFRALTVVDFRRTFISDREISCLNKTPQLKEMYLEAPSADGRTLITDMAITSFGATLAEWNAMGFFVLLMEHNDAFMPSPLQVVELCNYVTVTDTSLRHCAQCLKGLKLLNVKGTSCTERGVITFKNARPDVEIISSFDLEVGSSNDNT
ncbi:uncharacterized protein LOC128994700 [Macrosteles quadrilineatus]|uniref:uncharacterized protein LOC128994700 n=1 Tax=Macrosteles quadrilineatus TaxID=74068 RepID=UPI0023E2DEB4|nr:uncharacterized protein LOC128994700 [Macrosteles quadrilineatus]